MEISQFADGFEIALAGKILLRQGAGQPAFFIGQGEPPVKMNHGHFKVADYLVACISLPDSRVSSADGTIRLELAADGTGWPLLIARIQEQEQLDDTGSPTIATRGLMVSFTCPDPLLRPLWIRIPPRRPIESGAGRAVVLFQPAGPAFSTVDFRTWGGTRQVHLADLQS